MTFDVEKYKRLFLSESKEHLENISKILEKQFSSLSEEDINSLFREAHSLKGMAAAMGYHNMSNLAHEMESLVQKIKGDGHIDDELKEQLVAMNDRLWSMLEEIERGREDKAAESDSKVDFTKPVKIEIQFTKDAPSIFARAFLVYKNIESFGEVVKSEPSITDIKNGKFNNLLVVELKPSKSIEPLLSYLSKVREITHISSTPLEELSINRTEIEIEEKVEKGEEKFLMPQSVKVEVSLLDNFVNIVGEILTIKSRLQEFTKFSNDIEFSNAINQMEIYLKDLQEKVMRLRLMPLEILFSRVPRWTRELARRLNKKVDVEISGENIELDRALVEALFDPLLHIIRNCIDHGIESPEEREKKGKPAKGKIVVKAEKVKDNVLVTISDDGKGIDAERVYEKAKKMGKFSEEFLSSLTTRQEKLYLVTLPGVSTKEEVTDISGRGVGLDVVRAVIESFGGTLEIDSELNKGTTIKLTLPSSISIVNVLFFTIGNHLFGVPVDKIIRVLQVRKDEVKEVPGGGYILNYEGKNIPAYFLHDWMKIPKLVNVNFYSIIIIPIKGIESAIIVDDFAGHKEVYLRPLSPPLTFIPGFYSSTILGDGRPVIILDIQGMKL